MTGLTVVSAHTTPGGRVRLRLSDGTTARVPRGSYLAELRKDHRLTVSDMVAVEPYLCGRWDGA